MKKLICLSAVFVFVALFTYSGSFDIENGIRSFTPGITSAEAVEKWQEKLNEACSNTHNAMSMSQNELKKMVEKCDEVRPLLENLDPKKKRIATKKLDKCRDLYFFMIESNVIKE